MNRNFRTLEQITEDFLWPWTGGLGWQPEFETQRYQALERVLCCIPQRDYDKLKRMSDDFCYFIPHERTRAMVYPFAATVYPRRKKGQRMGLAPYAQVLYLCPTLERAASDITVGIVAHELAHLVLRDEIHGVGDYDAQEEESWALVKEWGFGKEVTKVRAGHKWQDSWDQYMVKQIRKRMKKGGR